MLNVKYALAWATPVLVATIIAACPASANCGNDRPVGRECSDAPDLSATPELDSLLLFGSGAVGMGGYALTRLRAMKTIRRRDDPSESTEQ